MIYALGRGLNAQDMPTVRAIVRESADSNYSFSSIVFGIVNSTPFQMRMKPVAVEESAGARNVAAR